VAKRCITGMRMSSIDVLQENRGGPEVGHWEQSPPRWAYNPWDPPWGSGLRLPDC